MKRCLCNLCWSSWVGVLALTAGSAGAVENIAGAEQVVNDLLQIKAMALATNTVPVADDASKKLREDLNKFKTAQSNLTPAQAAVDWLALLDRFWALAPRKLDRHVARFPQNIPKADAPLSLQMVMESIPGPASWGELAARVAQRPAMANPQRELNLGLLAAFLAGQSGKMQDLINNSATNALGLEKEYLRENTARFFKQMRFYNLKMNEPDDERRLPAHLAKILDFQKEVQSPNLVVRLPNLAGLVDAKIIDEQQAAGLIEKALTTPEALVMVPGGGQTLKMAQKIALVKIEQLQKPQWGLVASLEAGQLYEALTNKFPHKPVGHTTYAQLNMESTFSGNAYSYGPNDGRNMAQGYYIAGLLAQGKTNAALTECKTMAADAPSSWFYDRIWKILEQRVGAEQLAVFYEAFLAQNPSSAIWCHYIKIAPGAGRMEAMLKLAEQCAARAGLSPEQQRGLMRQQISVYLAADQSARAVTLMRALLATNSLPGDIKEQAAWQKDRAQIAAQLMQIGKLLAQPELVAEGLSNTRDALLAYAALSETDDGYEFKELTQKFYDELCARGEFGQAESYARQLIARRLKKSADAPREYYDQHNLRDALVQLAGIYRKAGRNGDVLTLLATAPWWGAKDLLEIRDNGELVCAAAAALYAADQKAKADAILKAYLSQHGGDDEAYRLLAANSSEDLIPWLNELYARDRFEERPLIWKARLQLKAGNLTDAEASVRLALKVDPTDGEQKAGDRVYAYAVIADVLAAQGKTNDAAFFRNVVAAVRLAEKGDEFTEAGLIKRSLPLYEQAQVLFVDAYCVQWRLAERLYAMGDRAGAEKHYQIAFERMPEQFGQLASFCFGCEGVFDNLPSRSVAEKVLRRLEKEGPQRPQVYFLLGQLREAQMRYEEAYQYYLQALKMDPDYLDVWKQIAGLKDQLLPPQDKQDEVALKMLQLDPLQRHFYLRLAQIYRLKELWTFMDQNQKYAVPRPESFLTLTAAKEQIEKQEKAQREAGGWHSSYYSGREWGTVPTPGEALAKQEVVAAIINQMQAGTP